MVSALRSMRSFKKGSQCKALGPRCTGLSVTLALQNLADLGDLGVSENRGTPLNHPFLVGSVHYIRPFWETFHLRKPPVRHGLPDDGVPSPSITLQGTCHEWSLLILPLP